MKRLTILVLAFFVFTGIVMAQDEPVATYEWPTQYYPPEAIPDPPEPECDHTSDASARFEAMRILPPSKIRSFDPRTIEYFHEDAKGIYVGRLTMNKETIAPADLWKTFKTKWWWLLYCLKCGHAYTIVELSPAQLKGLKKKL